MLVLSRRVGESIVIGGNMRLTVTAIRGGEVRVAIRAPREIAILREELARRPRRALEPAMSGERESG